MDFALLEDEEAAAVETATAGVRRYGHFEIVVESGGALHELGHGAMGTTYRARDTILHSQVALKVVRKHVADSAAVRSRFLREARTAANLRHPNVASVFHYGEQDGECYYAMELVEGETLESRVRQDGPLPADTVLEIATHVARALAASEAQMMVHRDLKPSNIMLVADQGGEKSSESLFVKVIDFGLAKAAAASGEATGDNDTRYGFVGTPAYASPEQFVDEKISRVDTRSDIYSLGVTLWYLLSGRTPFVGRTLEEIQAKQMTQPLPIEQLKEHGIPAPLVVLLRSMLAVDPGRHPQTARELLEAIARCREQLSTRSRTTRRVQFLAWVGGFIAVLTAGDFLGLAGNAVNASEPHLHIHTVKGTAPETGPLRPLLFRQMFAIAPGSLSLPSTTGPWVRVTREGPPLGPTNALIWPLGRNPAWQGWQDLGGTITTPPAVASWGSNRLDVVAAGTDNQLYHKWWDGSAWHAWQLLGGTFQGAPAAVSWGPNRIDVFVRGTDNHLGHLWWNGSQWSGWQDLGGPISSAPAVTSWGTNRLDVFAAGTDGQLKHKWWDGSTWHDWQNLGGTFKDGPAAVSWGSNRIDVFVRGTDDHLGHLWWNGSAWQGWEDLGGPIASSPAAASWGANRLDVFAEGSNSQLQHKWWHGSSWSDWDEVGGTFQGNPAAVSWGPNRIDIFVRGMDNHLGHLWEG